MVKGVRVEVKLGLGLRRLGSRLNQGYGWGGRVEVKSGLGMLCSSTLLKERF